MALIDILYQANPFLLNPIHAILAIFGIAYLPAFLRIYFIQKKDKKRGGLDIANTRMQVMSNQDNTPEGLQISCCTGCHQNGLEAMLYFSIAVILCLIFQVDREVLTQASGLFVSVRMVYTMVYLTPALNGALRSVIYGIGMWIVIDLFLRAAEKW